MNKRGDTWLAALTAGTPSVAGFTPSVQVIDHEIHGVPARYINVTSDVHNPFPRARNGEVGLLEGWNIARAVRQIIVKDKDNVQKTAIVAVIDVPSQAYGRREEAYGIHLSLAAAANAYADARSAGHPVVGLIVGMAMSGGFLAHGYQASRLIALDDARCMVHAMGKASAARVTLRTVEQLEKLATLNPPIAYDIKSYQSLGLLWRIIKVDNADAPGDHDMELVRTALSEALKDIAERGNDWLHRLHGENRQATRTVRRLMQQAWSAE